MSELNGDTEPEVLVEQRDRILIITINRPKAKNSVNAAVSRALADAMDRLDADAGLSVGILTGAGGSFCAGMDLKAFARGENVVVEGRGLGFTERPPAKPLIAAVEGYALAGGTELALATDLIVAARDSAFGIPEVKRGLVAGGGGLLRLPERIPYAITMELALTGDNLSAERAHALGMVNVLAEPGAALDAAIALSVSLLLEMAASASPDRIAVVSGDLRLTTQQLSDLADGGAGAIAASDAQHVVYVGTGGTMLPLLIFASARAGLPFTSIDYRLSADGIAALIRRLPRPLVVVDERYRDMIAADQSLSSQQFLELAGRAEPVAEFPDPDSVAIVLFTSGTTSQPKAVELTHSNLTSYVTTTVEFGCAAPSDAALICVPPYHIAGVSAVLSNLYAGRKMVYLTNFDAHEWVRLTNAEQVTTATVVPTMLDRIVAVLVTGEHKLPSLRNLAYGGSKVVLPLVRRALELLPDVGFVNAYGLTETSSTIAVLTPDDHRAAQSAAAGLARRLGSVGRPVPGVELQIRGQDGRVLGPGETGELFVRGEQVSGRYTGIGSVLDGHGWFGTKDIAMLDEDGYLFIGGRSDDTIIRGGENIAPAELEEVLIEHPQVRDVAVVGVEDAQWGQEIVAVVVPVASVDPDPEELREFVRRSLRGSRTPDRVVFRRELPTTATGKILRREIIEELAGTKS